ncbi:AAA domain-containing protein [Streptomyces sp. 8N616]|uniref:AAA domain-containing protein n=1 Tax=Streptomyces sp. 8N616 TaxID=3457414 RepID=UPI003FD09236
MKYRPAVGLGADAALPGDGLWFEPYDEQRIDELQVPETTPLVLDADASQRKAVAAALEGRSFFMDGPPGTGKSQTITNMIAALMQAGRSVLFVSEKAAALDVVRNRLRDVGLDSFVLAIHSHDTSRKAMAAELGRSLAYRAQAPRLARQDPQQARRLREELSAYAAAMNEPRAPLGYSLHHVVGMISLLDRRLAPAGLPTLVGPPADSDWADGFDAAALDELRQAAGQVARAWRPVLEEELFPWHGLHEMGGIADPRRLADTALAALNDLRRTATRHSALTVVDGLDLKTFSGIRRAVRKLDRLGLDDDDAAAYRSASPVSADVSELLHRVADGHGLAEPQDVAEAVDTCLLADLAQAVHPPPADWLDPAVLRQAHAAAEELQAAVTGLRDARAAAEDLFDPRVLDHEDVAELDRRFREEHRGMLGRLSGRYRADRAAVTALTTRGAWGGWDKAYAERLPQALAWQSAHQSLAHVMADHASLLGSYARGERTNFAVLHAALATADRVAELVPHAIADPVRRKRLAYCLADGAAPDTVLRAEAAQLRAALIRWRTDLATRLDDWQRTTDDLLSLFHTGRRASLGAELIGEGHHNSLDRARRTLERLCDDSSGPDEWYAHQAGLSVLRRHHTDDIAARFAEHGWDAKLLPPAVERAVLRAWADAQIAADARLRATVRAEDRDALVDRFREADRRLVESARWAVLEACEARRPVGAVGQAAVIRREAEKKRRHMPVRELLSRTRDVVRKLKPCFMMSPLTVSSHLPPDFRFDVVIFDEASQVRPGDAVSSIYRADCLIVAGDAKQLPPTEFFAAGSGDDEEEEWTEDALDSFPSLLEMCKGSGIVRSLPLRWHYRSHHEDLIAFSNHRFYDGGMVTFPGASEHGEDTGVAFFKTDGLYDRGGRRDNRPEAEFVARRVLHHFDTRPAMSLGVVALSKAQADTIDEAVQQARLARPDMDAHFTEDRLHGFFVKNLEAVQGDERDVMILSIGYGRDADGKLHSRFGPVNNEGGWRRLNVAVTRARTRMEVVASFRGGELRDSDNEGVQALKRYLEYAERGPAALSVEAAISTAEPESPFEESVLRTLQGWGYDVQPQVGIAGYRVDFGVRHPRAVGTYALGIECDGAMYHSSRAARDRDRLRQQVLEGLGWSLYRIWGTDWYRNRPQAERRLKEAVERAVSADPFPMRTSAPAAESSATSRAEVADVRAEREADRTQDIRTTKAREQLDALHHPVPPADGRQHVTFTPVESGAGRDWSTYYQMADVNHLADLGVELHTAEARLALQRAVMAVVETEGSARGPGIATSA